MSRYNNVLSESKCPSCGKICKFTIFVYENFGRLDFTEYSIGDKIKWEKFDSIKLGGRPHNGTYDAVGWTECPNCNNEHKPIIKIISDKVADIKI